MSKNCLTCHYLDCFGGVFSCKAGKDMQPGLCGESCDAYQQRYKTRGDAVREMTNEQLAVMLAKLRGKPWVLALDVTMYSEYDVDEWREWLDEAVK